MTHSNDDQLPEDLREVVEELRTRRTESGALELDRIKHTAMARASRASASQNKGFLMRSKILTLALVLGLGVSGGAAGVIAAGGDGGGNDSAAKSQYKPGKGCGDTNRDHTGPPGNPGNTDCPPQAGPKE